MRLNWGTGIVIAFIGFISFIMYFVVNMNANKKYDYDLVTDDYYHEELQYQQVIDKEKNALDLKENVSWTRTDEGMRIAFPQDFNPKQIKGKVFLYRPSNERLDIEIDISLSDSYLLIPDNRLLDGRWNILVDWSYQGKNYAYKEKITY